MSLAARASVACQIAGMTTLKFNGLVASGDYPCPPSAIAGATRIFEEEDVVALVIFSRLLDQGFKSKLAGRFACKAKEVAAAYPAEDRATFAWNMNGQVSAVPPGTNLEPGQISGGPIMFSVTFDMRNVRDFVRSEFAKFRPILGD